MNENQKQYLANWLQENSFQGEKEAEWTPPTCIHAQDVAPLFEALLKIGPDVKIK